MREGKKDRDLEKRKLEKAAQDKEINETLSHIKNKILVMSGKGGVGKSSVAAYLSVALAKKGFKVGLMDVDLHGPSILRILGMSDRLYAGVRPNKAAPIRYLPNLDVVSIESLLGDKDAAMIWRGPLKGADCHHAPRDLPGACTQIHQLLSGSEDGDPGIGGKHERSNMSILRKNH